MKEGKNGISQITKRNRTGKYYRFCGSGLHESPENEAVKTVLMAMDNGINYFDLAVS